MALPFHLLKKYRWFFAIVIYIYVLSILSTCSVKLTIEKPKIQQTTAKLDSFGIETFDRLKKLHYQTYKTDFGNSSYIGMYHNLQIQASNYWGGSGGQGFYQVAFERTYYRLIIQQDGKTVVCTRTGPNYFGLWISSFDADNHLEFYYKGNRTYALNTQDVKNLMGGSFGYRGNPTYWFRLPIKHYVFLNLFFDSMTYDEIRFIAQDHRFETDNHSIGHYIIKSCEVIPISTTTAPALSTTAPTLPTTTAGLFSTEGAIPVPTASTRALPKTTLGPIPAATKFFKAAVVVGIILALVAAGIIIFSLCHQQSSASSDASVQKQSRAALERQITDREIQVEWGE